jgi:adenylate kinase family enzyme
MLGGTGSHFAFMCDQIIHDFAFTPIKVEQLLDREVNHHTQYGMEIQKYRSRGLPVPDQLVVIAIMNQMLNVPSQRYLIEGFPRSLIQAHVFERYLLNISKVITYDHMPHTRVQVAMAADNSEDRQKYEALIKKEAEHEEILCEYFGRKDKLENVTLATMEKSRDKFRRVIRDQFGEEFTVQHKGLHGEFKSWVEKMFDSEKLVGFGTKIKEAREKIFKK